MVSHHLGLGEFVLCLVVCLLACPFASFNFISSIEGVGVCVFDGCVYRLGPDKLVWHVWSDC